MQTGRPDTHRGLIDRPDPNLFRNHPRGFSSDQVPSSRQPSGNLDSSALAFTFRFTPKKLRGQEVVSCYLLVLTEAAVPFPHGPPQLFGSHFTYERCTPPFTGDQGWPGQVRRRDECSPCSSSTLLLRLRSRASHADSRSVGPTASSCNQGRNFLQERRLYGRGNCFPGRTLRFPHPCRLRFAPSSFTFGDDGPPIALAPVRSAFAARFRQTCTPFLWAPIPHVLVTLIREIPPDDNKQRPPPS